MKFSINYPHGMVEPKGLHVPQLEDIQEAVKLAEIITKHVNIGLEEYDEFPISVSDEVFVHSGKLIDVSVSEGIRFYPSVSRWTVESLFETILSTLLNNTESVAISKINLTVIAEQMKILINFIWNLRDELPIINDFCNEHDYIIDTSITVSEKIS